MDVNTDDSSDEPPKVTQLLDVNDDCLVAIFGHLSALDLATVADVCGRFREIARECFRHVEPIVQIPQDIRHQNLTPYLVDATNELVNNKSSPISFNEICSNFECNTSEEDYIQVNIGELLPKVYDVLLARITYKQVSCFVKTLPRNDQANDKYCNCLYGLHLILDGGRARPEIFLKESFMHQRKFNETTVTHFAGSLAKYALPYDLFMSIMILQEIKHTTAHIIYATQAIQQAKWNETKHTNSTANGTAILK